MEKTLSAFEVRRNFGKVLQGVAAKGDKVVVERHGEPVAVVVPVELYRQWESERQKAREDFYRKLRSIAERADMDPDEADKLAEEAVRWARANKDA